MKRVALSGIFVLRAPPAIISTEHMNAMLPGECFLVLNPRSPVPHGYVEWGFMQCDGMSWLQEGLVVALRDQNPASLALFLNAAKSFAPDGAGDPEVTFVYENVERFHLRLKYRGGLVLTLGRGRVHVLPPYTGANDAASGTLRAVASAGCS